MMKYRRKILTFLLLLVLIVIGFLIINWRFQKTDQSNSKEEKIIGAILPLTGEFAQYGQSVKNGISIAFDEFDSIHSSKIKLIIEDDRGDAKTSLSALNKLVSDKIKIIIGAVPSGITLSIAPYAEKQHIILISPTSTATAVTNAGDYIFRVCVSDEFEGKTMADYIIKNFRNSRIGILNINNDYGNGLKNDFEKYLEYNSIKIQIKESYFSDTKNFRTIISKFVDQKIDLIYLVAQKEQSLIFKQMAEINYKPQVTGSTMIEDPDLLVNAKNTADGTIYTYRSYNSEDTTTVTKNFVSAYRLKFGVMPDFYAASGYDAARISLFATSRTKYNADEIKNYLYSIYNYPGVTGYISFDKNGDVLQPFSIKKIINNRFEFFNSNNE